ncbi:MAG: hypothetical protein AAF125_22930 [Chloroflexota bacterium]
MSISNLSGPFERVIRAEGLRHVDIRADPHATVFAKLMRLSRQ